MMSSLKVFVYMENDSSKFYIIINFDTSVAWYLALILRKLATRVTADSLRLFAPDSRFIICSFTYTILQLSGATCPLTPIGLDVHFY